jgi:hypothetical protein
MQIASKGTLDDMDIAAELRVRGAVGEDWDRLFNQAGERTAWRAANELRRPT